ncbi:hypothetical protein BRADI_1g24815v3 [Brachypodium distachyon]|uniref:Uncharacterized protein n=1 Tax=Brachypodium distachyon TaxID=15368 RepID=A0A2K2DKY8_BRADI|nr:hypothetical protein BRADI_1g24815v3 [Brachypodium distachyon]
MATALRIAQALHAVFVSTWHVSQFAASQSKQASRPGLHSCCCFWSAIRDGQMPVDSGARRRREGRKENRGEQSMHRSLHDDENQVGQRLRAPTGRRCFLPPARVSQHNWSTSTSRWLHCCWPGPPTWAAC